MSHFRVLVLNHSSNNTVFCLHGFVSLKKQRKWMSACTFEPLPSPQRDEPKEALFVSSKYSKIDSCVCVVVIANFAMLTNRWHRTGTIYFM